MQTLKQSIRIRDLIIDPPLLLAPMVALTHSALRQIIAGFGGAGLLSTEMLSAKRLPSDNVRTSPYLIRTPAETPLSCQILTSGPHEIPRAIDVLHGLKADAIDVNLGCPDPGVGRSGGGISLMERPGDVRSIVAGMRNRTGLPLTAKIRLGPETDDEKLKDFCVMLQDEGLDMLSVHARLKKEPFGRRPRWDRIAHIKAWLTIPVIANGGIFTAGDAEECLHISGADGLMLGRGAAIRPWLFSDIARRVYGRAAPEPAVSLPLVYARFVELLNEHFLPEHRLSRLRLFTRYFAENYQFGHHLASRVLSSRTMQEARERAALFFEKADASQPCSR